MYNNATMVNATIVTNLQLSLPSIFGDYANLVREALTEGSERDALMALSEIAIVTLIPLTLIQNAYCFSVGYGASVAAMSLAMLLSFDVPILHPGPLSFSSSSAQRWLALSAWWYGVRLTSFLVLREASVKRMRDQSKFFQKHPYSRVLPMAVTLGVFYAFMVSPILYTLREVREGRARQQSFRDYVPWAGVVLAYLGLILEALADQHKFEAKRRQCITYGEKRFVGPTNYTYALCRHPNYLGEILFWTGLWIGGAVSFGSWTAWLTSTSGWVSILLIMKGSAARLDKKQQEWYGEQPEFEKWKTNVKGSLLPKW